MKKGFTLVELLGVIVILGILALVVTVSVRPVLNNSRNSLSELQIKNVETAAKEYYLKEGINEPHYDEDSINTCVNVEYLLDNGYIENEEVINPKNDETLLGSVKITYDSINYKYEYQNNTCTNKDLGRICQAVTEETKTSGNVPSGNFEIGDEYLCEIKKNVKYRFFILSTEGSKVNLILEKSINKDGTLIEGNVSGQHIGWANGCNGDVSNGPLESLEQLYSATSLWDYIPNFNETYDDSDGGKRYTIKLTGNARLPKLKELQDAGCENTTTCPTWLTNYTKDSSTSADAVSYWTMTTYSDNDNWVIYGILDTTYNLGVCYSTVRPVISISKDYFIE